MWALLNAVRQHNQDPRQQPIQSLLCPGLGIGTGKMSRKEAAHQTVIIRGGDMGLAYPPEMEF